MAGVQPWQGMCVCESVFAVEGVVVKKSCQRVFAFTPSRYLTVQQTECVIIFILTFLFIFYTPIMVSNMFLGKESLELFSRVVLFK